MSKQIITALPDFKREVPCCSSDDYLKVAEFFYDTIQGEGINIGAPAAFLRLQGCTQNCIFCDTQEVWRFGNPYTFAELFERMDLVDLPRKLHEGQHLVLTGGSPLLQQKALANFIEKFISIYSFKPFIEIENECTLMPNVDMQNLVDCWNNSPKLANSYNPQSFRYQPAILEELAELPNSWFKFVVNCEEDWKEIHEFFLATKLLRRDQIILMPMGATRDELFANRQIVVDIAIRENVRYSTREHIVLWDKRTGV